MKRLLTWVTATPMVLLAAVALLLCCCTANWLPDSSGFVTISQQGKVVLFDLASGQEKEIVPGAKVPQFGSVAVAPDSQRIAVAKMVPVKGQAEIQLSVYAITGELQHRAESIVVQPNDEPYQVLANVCCWSPDGKQILLCPFGNDAMSIRYDLATQQVQRFEGVLPLGLMGFDSLPLRAAVPFLPDSSGFLSFGVPQAGGPQVTEPAPIRLCSFAPEGAAPSQPFAYTPAASERFAPPEDAGAEGERVHLPAHWSQGKLLMTRGQGYLVVDPETKTVDYREDPKIAKLAAHAQQHDVRVVDLLGDKLVVQMKSPGQLIEIADRETGEVRGKVDLPNQQSFPITVAVAPNRQFLLVTCSMPQPQFWVFDVNGKQIKTGS